jgi:uncharacterized protein YhaN
MLRPRIELVEIRQAPHDDSWKLPDHDGPVVIAGPNGSGKSTFVEQIVACLFGPPLQPGDAAGVSGNGTAGRVREGWCRVELSREGERFEIRRDLSEGSVAVRSLDDGAVRFEGTGEAQSRSADSRRYRLLLADLLGVSDATAYTRTLFVRQGALPSTQLGDHLLKLAVGGHVRVEAARRDIAEAHRALTSRPLRPGERAAVNPRELEKVEEEIAAVLGRLEAARDAGARRAPLALDRERLAERLRQLNGEIEALEDAHAALLRGSAIEVNTRQLRELVRKLEQRAGAVPAAAARLGAATARADVAAEGGLYPDDFAERMAAVEVRWRDLERISGKPPRWLAGMAMALAVVAVSVLVAGLPLVAAVAVGSGAAVAGAAWLALWLEVRQTRGSVAAEVGEILAGVPGGATLAPGSRAEAMRAFESQRLAAREVAEAREALAGVLRDARRDLREANAAGVTTGDRPDESGRSSVGVDRIGRAADRVGAALKEAQSRLRRDRSELDRVGDASLRLPDGVVPTGDGVAQALRARRDERRRAQEELHEVGQELMERGTPAESLDALEASLSSLTPRRDALVRKAEVLEAAHELLTEAYESFRANDQDRLVGLISEYAGGLTDGAMGPLVVEGVVEAARVRSNGRLLPLRSPPLSFGELHALFLAVRLGTADFLGGLGVFPPLILDEPFAHLDPERAACLWEMLRSVAADRQVIVTTQDRLLLAALQIEPDIVLGDRPPVNDPDDVSLEAMPAL